MSAGNMTLDAMHTSLAVLLEDQRSDVCQTSANANCFGTPSDFN